MSGYVPAIPAGGLTGWTFLTRTLETQKAAHASSAMLQREFDYFRENIANVSSAEELVADRTLLKVSLGAFGLQDDLPNKYFIRKILEEGTTKSDSLSNKLSDSRYKALSKAFGFGEGEAPRNLTPSFANEILSKYQTQSFEAAVGESDTSMRLALGLERELLNVVAANSGEDARWFALMGTPPLREVFETALGLPEGFGALDIDKQMEVFRDKADQFFGASEVADFIEPELLDDLRERFLLFSEPSNAALSSPVLQLFGGNGSAGNILATLYS